MSKSIGTIQGEGQEMEAAARELSEHVAACNLRELRHLLKMARIYSSSHHRALIELDDQYDQPLDPPAGQTVWRYQLPIDGPCVAIMAAMLCADDSDPALDHPDGLVDAALQSWLPKAQTLKAPGSLVEAGPEGDHLDGVICNSSLLARIDALADTFGCGRLAILQAAVRSFLFVDQARHHSNDAKAALASIRA
jgi:hypothetical protein